MRFASLRLAKGADRATPGARYSPYPPRRFRRHGSFTERGNADGQFTTDMKLPLDNDARLALDAGKIGALADGIFSIAMTLLVFNINSSDAVGLSGDELSRFVISSAPSMTGYFVSFWVI